MPNNNKTITNSRCVLYNVCNVYYFFFCLSGCFCPFLAASFPLSFISLLHSLFLYLSPCFFLVTKILWTDNRNVARPWGRCRCCRPIYPVDYTPFYRDQERTKRGLRRNEALWRLRPSVVTRPERCLRPSPPFVPQIFPRKTNNDGGRSVPMQRVSSEGNSWWCVPAADVHGGLCCSRRWHSGVALTPDEQTNDGTTYSRS